MIVVGSSALQKEDGSALLKAAVSLANRLQATTRVEKSWKVLNVLHRVRDLSQIIQDLFVQGYIYILIFLFPLLLLPPPHLFFFLSLKMFLSE